MQHKTLFPKTWENHIDPKLLQNYCMYKENNWQNFSVIFFLFLIQPWGIIAKGVIFTCNCINTWPIDPISMQAFSQSLQLLLCLEWLWHLPLSPFFSQVGETYSQVHQSMIQAPIKNNVPFFWTTMSHLKTNHYNSLAHYFVSTALLDHQCKLSCQSQLLAISHWLTAHWNL